MRRIGINCVRGSRCKPDDRCRAGEEESGKDESLSGRPREAFQLEAYRSCARITDFAPILKAILSDTAGSFRAGGYRDNDEMIVDLPLVGCLQRLSQAGLEFTNGLRRQGEGMFVWMG